MYKCLPILILELFLSYIPGSITALWISYESLEKPKTMESYLILSTKSNGCCLQVYVSYSQFAMTETLVPTLISSHQNTVIALYL